MLKPSTYSADPLNLSSVRVNLCLACISYGIHRHLNNNYLDDDVPIHNSPDVLSSRHQSPIDPPVTIHRHFNNPRCTVAQNTLFRFLFSVFAGLIVDESVSLFIIFKIPVEAVETDQLDVFLKETVLTLEVAITETTRQQDPTRREKFEGVVVHTATISEESEKTKEQIEDHWLIAWNLSVPISTFTKLPPS